MNSTLQQSNGNLFSRLKEVTREVGVSCLTCWASSPGRVVWIPSVVSSTIPTPNVCHVQITLCTYSSRKQSVDEEKQPTTLVISPKLKIDEPSPT